MATLIIKPKKQTRKWTIGGDGLSLGLARHATKASAKRTKKRKRRRKPDDGKWREVLTQEVLH